MKKEIILKSVKDKDFFTVEEAATFLSVKASAIRNYLYLEKFTTYKFKTQTLISVKEVIDWKNTKQRK